MAAIEDLVKEVHDPDLRMQLQAAVRTLKEHKRFGLVFEEHIPEVAVIPEAEVTVEDTVIDRTILESDIYRVTNISGMSAQIEPVLGGSLVERDLTHLRVVRRFSDPIYPALDPIERVGTGASDRRSHTVICGENYHALKMLSYLYRGQVDCIYIDPPYNTGDRSWKYNNKYVDSNDTWSHSHWLSMMEKRLRIAKQLLKPDGVLIVTIDEHEVHHLGLLLEDLFPRAYRQMVTIVITARGVQKQGLARVEEYALFTYLGDASANPTDDDFLTETKAGRSRNPWASLLRRGTNALPSDRKNLVYPIFIDPETKNIIGVGESVDDLVKAGKLHERDVDIWQPERSPTAAWPTRSNGALGTWQVIPEGALVVKWVARRVT